MSIVAIVPVAHMKAANDHLEGIGANNPNRFGPSNFSVPAYGASGATHAVLHAWDDPAFRAALLATPNVTLDDAVTAKTGDHVTRVNELVELNGAKWGAQAPTLPSTGNVTAGDLYQFDGTLWSVIQTFSRSTYGAHPSTYPALIRHVRDPRKVEPWRQPIDQYDAYKLVNPFTNAPDECTENGTTYRTKIDNNVWSPSGYPAGWEVKP